MGELINLNPPKTLTDADIPALIARDTETAAAIAAHEAKDFPHNPVGIEFATANSNYLDFHTSTPYKDFDGRIIVYGGGASNGLAEMLVQIKRLTIATPDGIAIQTTGTAIKKLLSLSLTVDPPSIGDGAVWSSTIPLPTSAPTDVCLVAILGANASLPLFLTAAILSAGIVTIYLRNISSVAIDPPVLSIRVIVIGF